MKMFIWGLTSKSLLKQCYDIQNCFILHNLVEIDAYGEDIELPLVRHNTNERLEEEEEKKNCLIHPLRPLSKRCWIPYVQEPIDKRLLIAW